MSAPPDPGLGLEYVSLAADIEADCSLPTIEPLLSDEGRPVFADSWEAEAFIMGKMLVADGLITPREWYDTISGEIKAAQERGDPDRGDTHYQHWMDALERICVEKDLVDAGTLMQHQAIWSIAVAKTPHGTPILFENAFLEEDEHDHEHEHGAATEDPPPVAVYGRDEPPM